MTDMIHAIDHESSGGESMGDLMVSQSVFVQAMADEDDAFRFSWHP